MAAKPPKTEPNTADWASLSLERKALAVGVTSRTLSSYKTMGCPIDESEAAINRWRANNIAPRNGGTPTRRGGMPRIQFSSSMDLLSQAVGWYIDESKKSLDLLDAMRSMGRDQRLSEEEREEVIKRVAALIKMNLFCLWLRLPANTKWLRVRSPDEVGELPGEDEEDPAFEAFYDSTIAEILESDT